MNFNDHLQNYFTNSSCDGEIIAYIVTSTFNDDCFSLLFKIIDILNINILPNTSDFCNKLGKRHIKIYEHIEYRKQYVTYESIKKKINLKAKTVLSADLFNSLE